MARISPLFSIVVAGLALCLGCSSNSPGTGGGGGGPVFLSMGTAPVGGAFQPVGTAISEVLNAHKDVVNWKLQAKGTKGSQENIRKIHSGDLELALSNAAISYFAARGEGTWKQRYDIRAVATLAPNVALFIARADSGISSVADLKGKRVITGPAGAGFQMFVEPILVEHGVNWDDISSLNATQSGAVDQLADGSADAAFLGGAVPTGSITQAASTFDVSYIRFDEEARQRLIEKYPFFHPQTIKAGIYKGLDEDFQGLNVGSMHLITSARADEPLVYEITKAIWQHREEIAGKHPAGKAINDKNVARQTGVDYHPGAARFYMQEGLWPVADDPNMGTGDEGLEDYPPDA